MTPPSLKTKEKALDYAIEDLIEYANWRRDSYSVRVLLHIREDYKETQGKSEGLEKEYG
jgi:hypothetical protein